MDTTLEQRIKEIRKEVECLRREIDVDPGVVSRRKQAACESSTRERENRVKAALVELQKVEETSKPDEQVKSRASTSAPEARVMKMADGGFRHAYWLTPHPSSLTPHSSSSSARDSAVVRGAEQVRLRQT